MNLFFLLLMVAFLVAALHMIAPDHWLPLTVISSARDYRNRRKYGTAGLLGLTHAGTSIILALGIYSAGLLVIHSYLSDLILAGQILLVAIGVYFIVIGYRENGTASAISESSAISVSAFPDLSLMPIVISASSLQISEVAVILLIFTIVSAVALTAMVFVAGKGLGKLISRVPPKYMDYLIGAVLIATAVVIRFTP